MKKIAWLTCRCCGGGGRSWNCKYQNEDHNQSNMVNITETLIWKEVCSTVFEKTFCVTHHINSTHIFITYNVNNKKLYLNLFAYCKFNFLIFNADQISIYFQLWNIRHVESLMSEDNVLLVQKGQNNRI